MILPDHIINSLIDKLDNRAESMDGINDREWIDGDLVALDEMLVEAGKKQEFTPFIKDDPLTGRQVKLLFEENHKYIADKMYVINRILRKHYDVIDQYKGVSYVVKGFDLKLKSYIDTLISSRSVNSDRISKLEGEIEHLMSLVDILLKKVGKN